MLNFFNYIEHSGLKKQSITIYKNNFKMPYTIYSNIISETK